MGAHASDPGGQGLSENASDFDLYDPPDLVAEQQYYRGVAESDGGADFSELDHQLNLLSAGPLEAPPQPETASLEGCAVQADSASLQVTHQVDISARVSDELIARPSLSKVRFPWERGPMKAIFSDEPPMLPRPSRMPLWCKDSQVQPPAHVAKDARPGPKVPLPGGAIFAAAIRVSKNVSFKARRSEILEVSLGKLVACLRLVSINFVPPPWCTRGGLIRNQLQLQWVTGRRGPFPRGLAVSTFTFDGT